MNSSSTHLTSYCSQVPVGNGVGRFTRFPSFLFTSVARLLSHGLINFYLLSIIFSNIFSLYFADIEQQLIVKRNHTWTLNVLCL